MLLQKRKPLKFIDRSFYSLGTVNYIKAFGCQDQEILDHAVRRVYEIDDKMSAFKNYSYISRINRNSGRDFIKIDYETMKLLERSIEFSRLSCGVFDATIRPLVELWGIGRKRSFIPDEFEIGKARKLVNFNDLMLDSVNCRAALRHHGQAIDLGGIAKGHAADEVRRILLEGGVESAMINLGGNIATIGSRPDGTQWQIGIQNPMAATGRYLGVLLCQGKTVVTSGSNERFFIKDSVRYHHIIDPRTGKPAQSSLLSVTAVCSSSVDADALTTAIFILGPVQGRVMLEKVGAEALFIGENLEVITTGSLKEHFRLNDEYRSIKEGVHVYESRQ